MKQKMHRTTIMLTRDEVEFLDDAAYDFRKTSGKRITRGAIIRAAVNYLSSMDAGYRYAVIKVKSDEGTK